jgi:hypothetical protein
MVDLGAFATAKAFPRNVTLLGTEHSAPCS